MGRSSPPLSKRARSSRMQELRSKQSETPNKPSSCQGLFNDSPLKQERPPLRNKSAPSLTTVSDDPSPPTEASASENTLPLPPKKRGAPVKTLDACSVRRRIERISQYGYPAWVINQRTLSHVVEFHLLQNCPATSSRLLKHDELQIMG